MKELDKTSSFFFALSKRNTSKITALGVWNIRRMRALIALAV
jgi:hypothetical protein